MSTFRRLTVDAVIKMANAAAQKHLDSGAQGKELSTDLVEAVSATWDLVKGRLGQSESAHLDELLVKILGGKPTRNTHN